MGTWRGTASELAQMLMRIQNPLREVPETVTDRPTTTCQIDRQRNEKENEHENA